jgi:FKBP-type peptidyl-prolyl cis-trans isomerase FkpA
MKKLNTYFKICTVVLFALVLVLGCKKTVVTDSNSSVTEANLINTWVKTMVNTNNIVDSTSTGLHYIISKVGTGATVTAGNTVTLKYTGKFVDGTVFDSSASFTYVHKASDQRMIPGFEEGIEKVSKGGSGIFLIPSAQAYGTSGYSTIPPYTPLIFYIEITDIK